MAGNQTITVLEADGVTQTDVEVLGMGRQAVTASKSVGLSTEDKAVLDSLATKLDTVITAVQLIDNLVLAIDTATGATSPGLLALASRDDVLSTLTPIEGDNVGLRTTSTGALWVQDASLNNNGQAVSTLSSPVTLASDQILVDDAAFTPATSQVLPVGYFADDASTDSVNEGDIGAARMTLDRKIITTPQPHTAGGLSIFRSLDLDESEEEIKATAGCLYKLRITNRVATARYIKLYNLTAANTTVGTSTVIDTIVVPGASTADLATVITENFGGLGLMFDTAISIAATTGFADADTGAPGANDVIVSAYYK